MFANRTPEGTLEGALNRSGWSTISPGQLRAEVASSPLSLVLMALDDCAACSIAKAAISLPDLHRLGVAPIEVRFREMHPDDVAAMEGLRVGGFPEVRLYAGVRLVSAWRGIAEGASAEAAAAFHLNWLARTLMELLQSSTTKDSCRSHEL